mmetsp:Transcript_23373/g.61376  ORF Transcript_23373/g.61376 Transcript_23373/m.61376 type:complete len:202 (+) Transcript_23373:250-855(+)
MLCSAQDRSWSHQTCTLFESHGYRSQMAAACCVQSEVVCMKPGGKHSVLQHALEVATTLLHHILLHVVCDVFRQNHAPGWSTFAVHCLFPRKTMPGVLDEAKRPTSDKKSTVRDLTKTPSHLHQTTNRRDSVAVRHDDHRLELRGRGTCDRLRLEGETFPGLFECLGKARVPSHHLQATCSVDCIHHLRKLLLQDLHKFLR